MAIIAHVDGSGTAVRLMPVIRAKGGAPVPSGMNERVSVDAVAVRSNVTGTHPRLFAGISTNGPSTYPRP